MIEIKAIIKAYDEMDKSQNQAALATVVRVEGSSYRRTGARMLVMDNGLWIGGISGGCLEGDALKRARLAISKSKASLVTYDTTRNDAHQIGVGLGCQGIIDVLFTPLDFDNPQNPIEILKSCIQEQEKAQVLITLMNLEGKWDGLEMGNLIWYKDSKDLEFLENTSIHAELEKTIQETIQKGYSRPAWFHLNEQESICFFIEILAPEIHVVCWGNQYDIHPLISITRELGWRITVLSNSTRFLPATKGRPDVIIPEDELDENKINSNTAMVLMSHDFNRDKQNLKIALKTKAPYIGILGPKTRAEKIFSDLEAEGFSISEMDKERIYAPAGLDIGAQNPEEIALSILAEIRTCFSDRKGGFLKNRTSSIHTRIHD